MSPEQVAAAAAAWTWYPDDARVIDTDDYLLARYPDWFTSRLQLLRFQPSRPTSAVLDEVLERSGELDAPMLTAWVRLGAPADLDDALLARGGELGETLDVLALDLTRGVPDLAPAADLDLRWVDDLATVTDVHTVDEVVFGESPPPAERLAAIAAEAAADRDAGRGGRVAAYHSPAPPIPPAARHHAGALAALATLDGATRPPSRRRLAITPAWRRSRRRQSVDPG